MTAEKVPSTQPGSKRRERNRVRRSDVVWTIVFFFVLQLGLAGAIESGIVKIDDATTFATKARLLEEKLQQHSDDPFVTLAFGSSRMMNGLNAGGLVEPFQKQSGRSEIVYNFGSSGCGNIYSFLALEKLLASEVRPDRVLIEMSPTFLRPDSEVEWFTANEMRCKNFTNTERYGIPDVSRPLYQKWLIPWHTYRFNILNRFAPKLVPMALRENWAQKADDFGWIAVDRSMGQEKLETQVKDFAVCADHFQLGGYSCKALRDSIQLCKENGIDCVVVWLPEPVEIRDEYSDAMLTQVNAFIDDLSKDFQVPVINARAWIPNEGFYDGCHLNREGATKFTSKLSSKALVPMQVRSIANANNSESATARR